MASAYQITNIPSSVEPPYSLVRCACCKNSAGPNAYLLQCLHTICESCMTRFMSILEVAKCFECGLHVGQSAYPIISHFIQPQTKMPIMMCVCKSFDQVADFFCVTCRMALCHTCRSLMEHNWCKIVTLYCDFHYVPWSGFCVSCNCAFCCYCETNMNVHGDHNVIFFANLLPDLLKDLSETETYFEKEFEKFRSILQIMKNHVPDETSKSVCATLEKMISHCFEILAVLILAKNSKDERKLFWLKRRSRLQLTKIEGKFFELTKDINTFLNKPTVLSSDQSISSLNSESNQLWQECISTDDVRMYDDKSIFPNLSFQPTTFASSSIFGRNSVSPRYDHVAYSRPNCFPPFMQNTYLVSAPTVYHGDLNAGLFSGQNFVESNNFSSHSIAYQNRNVNFSNAESFRASNYFDMEPNLQYCYLPQSDYLQTNIRPTSSTIRPQQWQPQFGTYANFAFNQHSPSAASFSNNNSGAMNEMLFTSESPYSREILVHSNESSVEMSNNDLKRNFQEDSRDIAPINQMTPNLNEYCKCCNLENSKEICIKNLADVQPGLDSPPSTPKLIIDEEFEDNVE